MIVDALAELRIFAVAQHVADERADLLRVAGVAAFADVDVATREFERRVRNLPHALDALGGVHHHGRDDLHKAADEDRDDCERGEGQRICEQLLVPLAPALLRKFEVHAHHRECPECRDEAERAPRARQRGPSGDENEQQHGVDHRRIQEPADDAEARRFFRDENIGAAVYSLRTARGFPDVPGEHDEADEIHQAAERADVHEHFCRGHGIEEIWIREHRPAFLRRAEHEALRDARDIHREHVDEDADGPEPEVHICGRGRMQRPAPQPRREPVEQSRGHEAVPAERAAVDVRDGPVAVVRERVHRADGHERALEGRHAVESHGCDEKFQDMIRAQLVPCAAQREQAVEHPAPRRRPEHEGENHSQRLEPHGQRGVQQMVRPCPDVEEHE